MGNVYFELTAAFNARHIAVALASGQAVVYYRIAIMSKDGDRIVRETPEACEHILAELERRGATYRPSAPLDVRWLAGGWSSHFESTNALGAFDVISSPGRPGSIGRPSRSCLPEPTAGSGCSWSISNR